MTDPRVDQFIIDDIQSTLNLILQNFQKKKYQPTYGVSLDAHPHSEKSADNFSDDEQTTTESSVFSWILGLPESDRVGRQSRRGYEVKSSVSNTSYNTNINVDNNDNFEDDGDLSNRVLEIATPRELLAISRKYILIGDYTNAVLFYEKGCQNLEGYLNNNQLLKAYDLTTTKSQRSGSLNEDEFSTDEEQSSEEEDSSSSENDNENNVTNETERILEKQAYHYEVDLFRKHMQNMTKKLTTLSNLYLLAENFTKAEKMIQYSIISLANTCLTDLDFFKQIEQRIQMLKRVAEYKDNGSRSSSYNTWLERIRKTKSVFDYDSFPTNKNI